MREGKAMGEGRRQSRISSALYKALMNDMVMMGWKKHATMGTKKRAMKRARERVGGVAIT
jgi:hypothetical protein